MPVTCCHLLWLLLCPCPRAGNVYAKFCTEEDAMECLKNLNGRFYAGRQIVAEFSPVTEFREARYAMLRAVRCVPSCNPADGQR